MLVGTGVDIVEISRIQRAIERFGPSFINRIFTESERRICFESEKRAPERFAARFAAKEAVMKSLGTGWSAGIKWVDIEVVPERGGKPTVALHGEAKRLADRLNIDRIELALSHSREYAVATAHALAA